MVNVVIHNQNRHADNGSRLTFGLSVTHKVLSCLVW